jgi:prepilin-type N-terminal cleavage/methylation domain-containing protein
MRRFRGKEKGFTLIELLIAIPIIALVALGATAAIIHLLRANDINHGILAQRQAQTAGDMVSQDGSQAQQIVIADDITDPDGFLNLAWKGDWMRDGVYYGRTENVTYTLVARNGLYDLERHDLAWDENGVLTRDLTRIIAQRLDASQMNCAWTDSENRTFVFLVVCSMGDELKSRTYEITPRCA